MEMETEDDWGTIQNNTRQESVETRRDRFVRIGNSRMRRVLSTLRLIGNLATPNYQYYDKDILAMHEAIRKECEKQFAKFKKVPRKKEAEVDFDLTMRQ